MAQALSTGMDASTLLSDLNYQVMIGDARNRLQELEDNSVDLIVTSPPYGSIKEYSGKKEEIGFNQSYEEYHHALMEVFRECVRVLHPGNRMVINIGDEFVSTTKKRPYHVQAHSAQIIANLLNEFPDDLIYTGTIHWRKVTSSSTSGGGKIMGSVYHPRNGHFFVNYEHIIVFKKLGKSKKPARWAKEESRFTLDERREWFRDNWEIPPATQDDHVAQFPMEIPERLIRMYSFVGETVLDPFLGSGTTLAAAAKHNRAGIGVELGYGEADDWQSFTVDKITEYTDHNQVIMT